VEQNDIGTSGGLCFDWDELENLFAAQYGELPCGGWLNPTFDHMEGDNPIFRCYYNNFDNEEDCWYYGYDPATKDIWQA